MPRRDAMVICMRASVRQAQAQSRTSAAVMIRSICAALRGREATHLVPTELVGEPRHRRAALAAQALVTE